MEDFLGFGALGEALSALSGENIRKILVVASASAWRRFNAPAERELFATRETRLFSSFSPNPAFTDILAGAEEAKEFAPDCIVALGGGSAIDTAKGIKAFAYTAAPYDPAHPEKLALPADHAKHAPSLAAVTTTAGSGAEATPAAVFYVGKRKVSLSHPSLLPDMAVVDPELTYSLPPKETAAGGFDALSQGVESYWSLAATEDSKKFAAAAIKYALPNLYNATHAPAPGNRYNMLMSAHMSGKAIAATRTTIPHGLSYHLVTEYGLRHGHAVALTLPCFFRINVDLAETEDQRNRMTDLLALMGCKTAEDAFAFWRNLLKACNLPPTLAAAGVDTREKIKALVDSFDVSAAGGHPAKVSADYLIDFLIANP